MSLTPHPIHRKQLKTPPKTNNKHCGPASTADAVSLITSNRIKPTITQIRERMGKTANVPTGLDDWQKAIRSYKLTSEKVVGGDWSLVLDRLKASGGVILVIKYSEIPRPLKGDKFYDDAHAVFIHGPVIKKDSINTVCLHDPLHDGRRSNIPLGPIMVELPIYRKATQAYTGAGKALGVLVKR
jgi:hypothetical protein